MGLHVAYVFVNPVGGPGVIFALGQALGFLLLGATALPVHGAVLVVGARKSRLPVNGMATARQACIGGVFSAPLVGAVYHPRLAPVGLLLALVGNLVGTYLGLATARVCGWIESIAK